MSQRVQPPRFVSAPPSFIRQDPTRTTAGHAQTMQWQVVVPPVQRPQPVPQAQQQVRRRPALSFSTTSLSALAQVLSVWAIGIGLSLSEDGQMIWLSHTAWAVFAMAATVLQLTSLFAGERSQLWAVQASSTACLVLFFGIVVLPTAATNIGFLLTAGVVAACVGCWFSPVRPPRKTR